MLIIKTYPLSTALLERSAIFGVVLKLISWKPQSLPNSHRHIQLHIFSALKHMFLEELFWSLFKCSPEGTSRNSLSPRDLYMSGSNRSCNKNHSCSFLEVRVSCLWSLKYQMFPIWKMQNIIKSKPVFFTEHSHWSTFRKKISACSNCP